MDYKGYTHGNSIVLAKPLPVPDGTEVSIIIPRATRHEDAKRKKRKSVVEETFGLIPADAETVRKVLAEDLYDA